MEEKLIKEIWEIYRACWSEAVTSNRDGKLQQIIAIDFEYYDPNIQLTGHQKLSDYMLQFQNEFSGSTFAITNFSKHHDRSLAHWDMLNHEKVVIGTGCDFAHYVNGKLKTISSFFKEA